MSLSCPLLVSVRSENFDAASETAKLCAGRKDIGAIISFTGLCRDEDGRLSALELEHYPGMAEAELTRIAEQAKARWPLFGISIIHRFGLIRPGENIVLVITASSHRQAAFEAASFVMDFLKTGAPFWKREHRAQGEPGGWIAAKEEDDRNRARWKKNQPD
ncbi:molybdenum cofactor biosynthesis protein MoaE [Brucella sp. BE17]|uniref:molybdenum cofactor biosynthesis protein MoaE n=1 Tax=Brucella sp. BE17 TaxID=3142977 RepID=UPI0031BAE6AA